MSFWPDDINDDVIRTPAEIMADAGKELENRTASLVVEINSTTLDDRIVLAFQVTGRDAGLTLNLFEATHRLEQAYPVRIDPPPTDIPEFLKKKQYIPGFAGIATIAGIPETLSKSMIVGTPGKYVENDWVCGTPSEFVEKLKNLFSNDSVKSRIISLRAGFSNGGKLGPITAAAENSQTDV